MPVERHYGQVDEPIDELVYSVRAHWQACWWAGVEANWALVYVLKIHAEVVFVLLNELISNLVYKLLYVSPLFSIVYLPVFLLARTLMQSTLTKHWTRSRRLAFTPRLLVICTSFLPSVPGIVSWGANYIAILGIPAASGTFEFVKDQAAQVFTA